MGTVGLSLLPAGSRRNWAERKGRREEKKLKRGSFFPSYGTYSHILKRHKLRWVRKVW